MLKGTLPAEQELLGNCRATQGASLRFLGLLVYPELPSLGDGGGGVRRGEGLPLPALSPSAQRIFRKLLFPVTSLLLGSQAVR